MCIKKYYQLVLKTKILILCKGQAENTCKIIKDKFVLIYFIFNFVSLKKDLRLWVFNTIGQ